MAALYHTLIYQPLLSALIFLYQTVAFHDLGVSIILLTIIIRLILYPFFHKSAKQQVLMQHMQPRLKEIQEKHKHDRQKQTEELMALYREYGVNPLSSFLFLLIQLPVLIALYQIFLHVFSPGAMDALYGFIPRPDGLHELFLGLINLKERSIVVVLLAAAAQYVQARLSIVKHTGGSLSAAEQMSRNMMFLGPIITLVIFINFPAAVALYWLVSSAFSILQQIAVNKQLHHGKLETFHKETT